MKLQTWIISCSFLSLISFVTSHGTPFVPPLGETGLSAVPFDMSQVRLTDSRLKENENRALTYLKNINVESLLYNFRANHKLSTKGATPNGGWDAPDFPFRTHAQGHFLNAWSYCYASLRDETCRQRAAYFVAELAICQSNNAAAGFNPGYLSGFPESEITAVEQRTLNNGNVPYYALHKTMSGLLDVWRHLNSTTARDVLLSMASWVDLRTAKVTPTQMQAMLATEFGGMNDVLADLYLATNNTRWLTAPAWGGGTWSTDYDSFWCCQGTGLETNTKLMDSIYFQGEGVLWVNLFVPSVLEWREAGVKVEITGGVLDGGEEVSLEVLGGGGEEWTMMIRVPGWVVGRGEVSVNREVVKDVAAVPGTYTAVKRVWEVGDRVDVRLPMGLRTIKANDNPGIAAVAYGPVVLAGNYGNETLEGVPALTLSSVKRVGVDGLEFTGSSGGRTVRLGPFYEARGFNYNVYWALK